MSLEENVFVYGVIAVVALGVGLPSVYLLVWLLRAVAKGTFTRQLTAMRNSAKRVPAPPAPKPEAGKVRTAPRPVQQKGGGYAILLGTYKHLDPEHFAPVLERALGLIPYEAVAAARDARGLLGERGVAEEAADRLVASLAQEEIEAYKLPVTRLLQVGNPSRFDSPSPRKRAFRSPSATAASREFCPTRGSSSPVAGGSLRPASESSGTSARSPSERAWTGGS